MPVLFARRQALASTGFGLVQLAIREQRAGMGSIGAASTITDLNCLSVIQYAVEVLKVKHILVTGHYGCGGVRASMEDRQFGLIDGWLRSIRDLYYDNRAELDKLATEEERVDRLCELNVVQQVANVAHTNIVQNAWHRGQALSVHGCIYGIKDGRWKSLDTTISGFEQMPPSYRLRRWAEPV